MGYSDDYDLDYEDLLQLSIDDKLHKHFEGRESENVIWVTKDGREMQLKDMESSHIINCINMLKRNDSCIFTDKYTYHMNKVLERRGRVLISETLIDQESKKEKGESCYKNKK